MTKSQTCSRATASSTRSSEVALGGPAGQCRPFFFFGRVDVGQSARRPTPYYCSVTGEPRLDGRLPAPTEGPRLFLSQATVSRRQNSLPGAPRDVEGRPLRRPFYLELPGRDAVPPAGGNLNVGTAQPAGLVLHISRLFCSRLRNEIDRQLWSVHLALQVVDR